MNGVHDLGGMQGFGPIPIEPNEPAFHAPWESRVLGLVVTTFSWGTWPLDAFRYRIEQSPAADYLRLSYYEKWLNALVQLLLGSGLVTDEELRAGRSSPVAAAARPLDTRSTSDGAPARPGGTPPEAPLPARFAAGERVRAGVINPVGHTRLPRYVRGKLGTIMRDHGVQAFPDTRASGAGERPQHVYSVCFTARELWGAEASAVDVLLLDAWDEYLERA